MIKKCRYCGFEGEEYLFRQQRNSCLNCWNNKKKLYQKEHPEISRKASKKYEDKNKDNPIYKEKKYNKNKKSLLKHRNKYNNMRKNNKIELKIECINYLGGKCSKCGYNKNLAAIDFHHLNPNSKEDTISNLIQKGSIKNFNDIKKELDKCVILCKNCHSELHYPNCNLI